MAALHQRPHPRRQTKLLHVIGLDLACYDTTSPVVLKYAWISSDCMREGVFQKNIWMENWFPNDTDVGLILKPDLPVCGESEMQRKHVFYVPLTYTCKTHRRVFSIGKDIIVNHFRSLPEVFSTLSDIVTGVFVILTKYTFIKSDLFYRQFCKRCESWGGYTATLV
jgi:hypothetical protein